MMALVLGNAGGTLPERRRMSDDRSTSTSGPLSSCPSALANAAMGSWPMVMTGDGTILDSIGRAALNEGIGDTKEFM